MKQPYQVGITGGIGSGKSVVCKIFSCLGIPVYDADSHAKEIMTTDGILIEQIKKEFGDLSYHSDGTLNRKYLSEVAFHDPQRLAVLNNLIHPRVQEDYGQWMHKQVDHAYVIKEAALLLEAESAKTLNFIITVYAPDSIRMHRVLSRDPHRDEAQVKAIMNKQLPEEEKMKRANAVIVNDDRTLVIPQVLLLHQQFTTRSI